MSRRRVCRLSLLFSILVTLITTPCHSTNTDNDINTDGQQDDYDDNLPSGIVIYHLLITKGPTGHLQCYIKTQYYNKTQ